MKTKAIVAGVVVLVVLLFVSRRPPQDITIRHVKSVQSVDITAMTFEIKNHTANPCIIYPHGVQVRNGSAWTWFRGVEVESFRTAVGPTGLVYYTVKVTNLPAKSVARFSVNRTRKLSGLTGFFKRVELNLMPEALGGFWVSLNPYDNNSAVFGERTEVTSDEFVETVK